MASLKTPRQTQNVLKGNKLSYRARFGLFLMVVSMVLFIVFLIISVASMYKEGTLDDFVFGMFLVFFGIFGVGNAILKSLDWLEAKNKSRKESKTS